MEQEAVGLVGLSHHHHVDAERAAIVGRDVLGKEGGKMLARGLQGWTHSGRDALLKHRGMACQIAAIGTALLRMEEGEARKANLSTVVHLVFQGEVHGALVVGLDFDAALLAKNLADARPSRLGLGMSDAKYAAPAARPRCLGHHVAPLRQAIGRLFLAATHSGLADGLRADGLPNTGQEFNGGSSAAQLAQPLHRRFVGEQTAVHSRLAESPYGQRVPAPGSYLPDG